MPSKRTNDSVERILQELNQEQEAKGIRDGVTDRNVDEILRSIPRSTAPADDVTATLGPIPEADMPKVEVSADVADPESRFSTQAIDDLLADLPSFRKQRAQTPPAPQPARRPAPAARPRQEEPGPQPRPEQPRPEQPRPEQPAAGPAPVQDAQPAPRQPARTHTVDTTRTGIINVSLTGRRADEPAPEPEEPQDQPDAAEGPAPAEPPRRRRGLFGLFGGRDERPAYPDDTAGDLYGDGSQDDARPGPAQDAQPEPAPRPEPEPEPEKYVYRSKYAGTRRVHGSLTETLSSIGLYNTSTRDLSQAARPEPEAVPASAPESEPQPAEEPVREYVPEPSEQPPRRKKRDTLEFTPGQKPHQPPEPEASTRSFTTSEPVGEPVMTGSDTLTTGFTVRMDRPADREDTHDFVAAVQEAAALHPGRHTRPAPEEHTATGQVRLTPEPAPEPPAGGTGEVALGAVPEAPGSTADFALDFLGPEVEQRPDTAQFVRGIEKTLNDAGPDREDATGRYAEAAARLTHIEPDEEDEPRRRRKGGRIRLDGTPEDEQERDAEGPFAPGGHPHRHLDYETAEDAPRVRQELDRGVLYQTVTAIVSGAAALVMIYLGIAAAGGLLPMPPMLAAGLSTAETAAGTASASAAPLLVVMLVLLLVTAALNWKTLAFGLAGLVRSPTPDTMPSLAAVGALVQLIAFLAQPAWYDAGRFTLMAGPAALLLCLNAVGKQVDARTVRANFDLVSAGVDHAVAYRLRDAAVLRTVTRGLGETKPSLLVSRPTVLLKNFLAGSASHRTSDKNQQQFSWILGACGLISLVFTLAYRQDAGMAVTAMAVVLCLGAPLAGTLISALPAQLMQRSAARVGAVIPGWKDIRQLGRVNVIQITARDLFPSGCVTLSGIRAVKNAEIEPSITYAASLFAETSGTLRDVFLGMVGDNRKLLLKVDDLKTVYGKGFVGWIEGKRVLAGNRALMEEYGIKVPGAAFEARHSVNQRRIIYLASSGTLMAMFQVSYQRDPDTAAVLESLRQAGMSMIVDCDDFNCDVRLIEAVYGLPSGSVKVLDAAEREALAPATAWLPESEGNMLHLGSFASFVGGLEAAAGAAEGEYRASIVLAASVLISCVLAVIMSLAGGIVSLPLPALVLYQLAWAVLTLAFPLTRRY